jgi:hypothetical protein
MWLTYERYLKVHIKHPRISYHTDYYRVIELAYNVRVEVLLSFNALNIDLFEYSSIFRFGGSKKASENYLLMRTIILLIFIL